MGESVRYVKSTDSNRGGGFRQPFTRLTGWRNPPLTNRRSVVAVDLTTGLPLSLQRQLIRKSAATGNRTRVLLE